MIFGLRGKKYSIRKTLLLAKYLRSEIEIQESQFVDIFLVPTGVKVKSA
jgi:hypothetical protein